MKNRRVPSCTLSAGGPFSDPRFSQLAPQLMGYPDLPAATVERILDTLSTDWQGNLFDMILPALPVIRRPH